MNESLDFNGKKVVWEVPKMDRALAEKSTSNKAEGAKLQFWKNSPIILIMLVED